VRSTKGRIVASFTSVNISLIGVQGVKMSQEKKVYTTGFGAPVDNDENSKTDRVPSPILMDDTSVVTSAQLRESFMGLGIESGDHIALGMSFKSIGLISGGPQSFIEALLDVVSPSGTVMVATFTRHFPLFLVRYHKVPILGVKLPVFRKEETLPYTGIIAEHMCNDPRAIRSNHPTGSFAAIGAKAGYLLSDHDDRSPSYSPYSKLADIKGKVLIIGLDYNFVGIRHEAQYKAGLLDCIPPYRGALFFDEDDRIKIHVRRDLGGCTERLPDMVINLREAGVVTEGSIGKAKAVIIPARESLDIMTDLLKSNPENYLCESPGCLWCREIERRLKLYDRIDDKKWFHRNSFLRFPLVIYNYYRLRDIAPLKLVIYLLRRVVRRLVPWMQ
jgi:aminoglycoside 3-N-acetyltransferase